MKICLLSGHAPSCEGARVCAGPLQGVGECELAGMVLPDVAKVLREEGHVVVVGNRSQAGGVTPSYSAKVSNAAEADLTLELHFNAATPKAEGCEVLHWYGSLKGRSAATALSRYLASSLGVRNRGPLPVCRNQAEATTSGNLGRYTTNAAAAFYASYAVFLLAEPCFAGSNAAEARLLGEMTQDGRYAAFLAAGILQAVKEIEA